MISLMRDDLLRVARKQGWVWSYRQALQSGYTQSEVRARVASGQWIRVFQGAYAVECVAADLACRTKAALLVCGPGLVAGRTTAAALLGFDVIEDDCIHLVGQRGTDAAVQDDLRVHQAALDESDVVVLPNGIRCTSPARTAVDLARLLPRLDALPVVDLVLGMRLCTPHSLSAELSAHSGLAGIVQAREMVALGDGRAESPMESRLRLRAIDGGLPTPEPQVWVCDAIGYAKHRVDLGWREQLVAGEYDGITHLARERQRRDRDRHLWLVAQGWQPLYFTDVHVYRRPDVFVAAIRSELDRRDHQRRRDP